MLQLLQVTLCCVDGKAHRLLDNLLKLGHYDVALALGKRVLQLSADNARAAQAVDRAPRGLLTAQANNPIRREHLRS